MNEFIKILIGKYVSGTLTDDEAARLAAWVKLSPENAAAFRREVRALEESGTTTSDAVDFWNRVSKSRFGKSRRNISFRGWWKYAGAAAAVTAVVLSLALTFESVRNEPAQQTASEEIRNSETVPASPKESQMYVADAGTQRKVVLPDGTSVTLNSGAKLYLSDDFNVRERRVDLDGEAFFEVACNPAKVFKVCCRDNEYIVRGTSFNVSSYANDRFSIVTLVTGRLEARVKEDVIMLTPGDELRIDKNMNQITKQVVDVSNSGNWRDGGRLSFCNLPLKYVANQLSHKYNVKINVHGSIEDIVYDGQLDRESLQDALRLISMTSPVELSVTEFKGEYYISRKSSGR